ncbi:MAG: ABC transporter transmembrane domain-containing protein, partial [Oscillospiraceae bacterium]|nr:ABC transporter transmembrane domain-containing protein [Oscillospiraceae bacterium]
MARNKFDIDEELESPFDIRHFKRAMVYVKKHAKKMIAALLLSGAAAVIALFAPVIVQYALDNTIPKKNFPQLVLLSFLLLATIILSVLLSKIRSQIMTVVSQDIIFDIRSDLFK